MKVDKTEKILIGLIAVTAIAIGLLVIPKEGTHSCLSHGDLTQALQGNTDYTNNYDVDLDCVEKYYGLPE